MDDTQPPSCNAPKATAATGADRPPDNGGSLFSGRGLVCVRGGRTVFEGLDFTLKSGDALVLLGPNG
ncbi:MAG: hypothetical protein V1253_07810, partial [Alphaproteobacteria bacterium]|nr:hypothetical protein [Alphaproteobacteria bacterium]